LSHEIRTLGVVGAGQMGNGIAHVAALSGYRVVLSDVSQDAVNKGLSAIDGNMARMVKKATLTSEAAAAARALIVGATTLDAMSEADLVVEAVSENESLKFRIFETLSRVAPAHALLCSNTSSISITAIAAHTDRPAQVVGMHFMNPVPVMKLVELIRGLATSDESFAAVRGVVEAMGKTPVEGRDMPGFIVNRVLMPYINEAVYALYEGIGSVEDIDTAMKLGTNVPDGPAHAWPTSSASTPASPSWRCCTRAWAATPSTGPARCCASTSRRAGSAVSLGGASTNTGVEPWRTTR
jgi:3-hydroxybutyryl-CoA dehydrogenase